MTARVNVLKAVAIAEAIRDLGSVPSGHLYARLMDKMDLAEYEGLIDLLKLGGVIRESGHVLTFVALPGRTE